MADASSLREEGNQHFKDGRIEEALSCYTKALNLGPEKDSEKAIIYKNRAACHLKMENYQKTIDDASKSLEISVNDPKALFRRCQGYDKLGKLEEAYKDASTLMKVDPKNTAILPIFKRLNPIIQEKVKEQNSVTSKVTQMFNLAFDKSVDTEKRLQAANNLIVLVRDETGACIVSSMNGIAKLKDMLEETDMQLLQAALRVLSCLTKENKIRANAICDAVGIPKILRLLGADNEDVSAASGILLQNLISYITGVEGYRNDIKKYEEDKKKGERVRYPQFKMEEGADKFVDQVFLLSINMLVNKKVSAYGRNHAMELMIKNLTWKDGVNWTKQFLSSDGIENLLIVAGTLKEFNTLPVTEESRMHASVALSKIYDDLSSDQLRNSFKDKCRDFFTDLFGDDIIDSKIEAVQAISTLLQGPFEVGNTILGTEGVVPLMLALANSENRIHQRVAVEAIVHSSSKKDRCSGLLKDAVPILRKLYQSSDDHIKARALVGLCKLGSFSGTDASAKPMADGSTLTLAKSCRKFLTNPSKDVDLRKWATEGLAFLTLDADVKEELIDDVPALKSLFDLAKVTDRNVMFAAVTILVNLTNSYDKQEVMPELVELAKFAKQHVPEEHPKDKQECIVERIHKLAKTGVVTALVALSSAESQNCRELISRVYLALATEEKIRGLIVQQGGAKALLPLAQDNTDTGRILAAHSLAKIAVTMNPETAFPGQRMYEVVRPLLTLLHNDRSGLQSFESLLALTNLGSVSDSVRSRIVSEKGLSMIEQYMFEEHEYLRRAASECMCNLVMNEKVAESFEGENDRVKLLVLFCGEEDMALMKAASGALAMLSGRPIICRKIIQVKPWYEIIQALAVNENPELQHRGCHILMNMMMIDKNIAEKLVESENLEVLMAISRLEEPERQNARKCAEQALEKAVELGLIKPQ